MRIDTRVEINAPASLVREKLLAFSEHADWNPFFTSIELVGCDIRDSDSQVKPGDRLKVSMKDVRSGKVSTFTPTVLSCTAKKFEWRGSLIGQWFFSGIHTFEFLEKDDSQKCVLLHHETFSGIAIPLLRPLLKGTQTNFEAMNNALIEVCENGC
ncbi:LAQU0S32e00100g1_1 [Lachancea quebecensis]|uniref:LAQU0S32e00100g1_1 n=1 Tax=Lachancea quebecensis TaxID=1654605 RepID=A0A0P1L060_9SACH|nr:LAQU0S32e00100g1_1 [Lachancea quebecensis]